MHLHFNIDQTLDTGVHERPANQISNTTEENVTTATKIFWKHFIIWNENTELLETEKYQVAANRRVSFLPLETNWKRSCSPQAVCRNQQCGQFAVELQNAQNKRGCRMTTPNSPEINLPNVSIISGTSFGLKNILKVKLEIIVTNCYLFRFQNQPITIFYNKKYLFIHLYLKRTLVIKITLSDHSN